MTHENDMTELSLANHATQRVRKHMIGLKVKDPIVIYVGKQKVWRVPVT